MQNKKSCYTIYIIICLLAFLSAFFLYYFTPITAYKQDLKYAEKKLQEFGYYKNNVKTLKILKDELMIAIPELEQKKEEYIAKIDNLKQVNIDENFVKKRINLYKKEVQKINILLSKIKHQLKKINKILKDYKILSKENPDFQLTNYINLKNIRKQTELLLLEKLKLLKKPINSYSLINEYIKAINKEIDNTSVHFFGIPIEKSVKFFPITLTKYKEKYYSNISFYIVLFLYALFILIICFIFRKDICNQIKENKIYYYLKEE